MFKAFGGINKVVKEKKIRVEYPKGYRHWKSRFEEEYAKTRSVSGALDRIHGKEAKEEGK